MSFGTSNRTQVAVIKEVTKGVTPATPAFQKMNYVGEGINLNIGTTISETIRDDRMIADLVRTSRDISGPFNAEVQAGAFEDFFASALQSSWSTAIAVSTGSVQVVASTRVVTCATGGSFTNAVIGQWIKLANMDESANDGWHKIQTVTDTENVILTTGSTALVDDTTAAGATIDGQYIRNGVASDSYTIEKLFQDVTTPTYFRFAGCEISKMDLTFNTGSILRSAFEFIGRSGLVTESAVAGATYADQSTNDMLDAVNNLGTIREDDSASTASFQSLSLSLDNNSRGQEAIGTLGYVGIAHGSITLTGSTVIYFEDKATFEKYQDGTAFSLSFILSSADGDMVVTIPRIKFSKMTVLSSAINTDVLASADFTAILDTTTDSMIQFDINPAT